MKWLFAQLCLRLFAWKLEREMLVKINEPATDTAAPSSVVLDLWEKALHRQLDAELQFLIIENLCKQEGMNLHSQAFRYIMYRDITQRLQAYRKIIEQRIMAR